MFSAAWGFPLHTKDVAIIVQNYLKCGGGGYKHFKDKRSGKDWI